MNLLATIFVLGLSWSAAFAQDDETDSELLEPPADAPSQPAELAEPLTEPPIPTSARHTATVAAVQRAAPSVFAIKTQGVVAFGRGPIGRRLTVPSSGEGSGALIDPRGLVLTNAHVVAQAQTISVVLSDGRAVPARLLGLDSDLDLAVLEVPEAKGMPIIPLGSSAGLMLGETVVAIGNPLGLGSSVSQGVVSQPLREVELKRGVSQDYIQIDAPINPGNSGGALVNLDGELVGIPTAIISGAENIGFAIPVDRALKIARDLTATGTVQAPWLGVDVADISRRRLAGTPLAAGATVVVRVHPDSPAARAGIAVGELLYGIDGRQVRSRADLNAFLAKAEPGVDTELMLMRPSGLYTAKVTTGRPTESVAASVLDEVLRVQVEDGERGARITRADPEGAWRKAWLKVGDEIVAVNGRAVTDAASLQDALLQAKAGHRPAAAFTVVRGEARVTLSLAI